MLGRQVGTSLLRLPRCARLSIRSLQHQRSQVDLTIRTLTPSALRYYAQTTPSRPGRPKKAVGEPSRPVKRAVKRAAKSPKEDAATGKVKARQATATKTKAKTPAKRKKKELSEEEKAKKAQLLARRKEIAAKKTRDAAIADLKKMALDPPRRTKQLSAWNAFLAERMQAGQFKGLQPAATRDVFRQTTKQAIEDFRNFSPAEREHYNHLAHTSKEKQEADYKQWLESHTVEEISIANKARYSLRKRFRDNKSEVKKWGAIKDEREVKGPVTAYAQFLSNRFATGDMKNIKLAEASKLVAQEWKTLSEGEKKKYNDLSAEDRSRYKDEFTALHGHAPMRRQAAAALAA